jgi:glycerophosphoryl diester phosphodiesterase
VALQVPAVYGDQVLVDARFVDVAHHQGLAVHVWTINDKAAMHRLLDLGADGIMSDQIALLREVLAERGQWHPRET